MKTSIKYLVATVLSISFIAAYVLVYVFMKDDETGLMMGLSMVSMAIIAITLFVSFLFLQPSSSERYQEYAEKRERSDDESGKD